MKIRELPETPVEPEHVAIANRGYRSIYNGLNLDNWKITEEGRKHWHANDWILSYDGKAESVEAKMIGSRERMFNHGFLFDIKPGEGFDGVAIGSNMLPTELTKPGQWYRLEGIIENEMMSIRINGEEVTSGNPWGGSAPFGLYVVGPAEFANIYVRDLKK